MKQYLSILKIKDDNPFISPPKGSDFSGFYDINKVGTAASAVSLFFFIFVMGGLGFMMISKFRSTSISEGILYVLTLFSAGPWLAITSTTVDEVQHP